MTLMTDIVNEKAIDFMRAFSVPGESAVATKLRKATADHPRRNMQVSVEQGRLMALLAKMANAKRCLEVGVFTGYSALCIAEQLPPDGKLVGCDISEEFTSVGKPFWQEAGVAGRIDLRIGSASDSLANMLTAGEEPFDFVFIDADKESYDDYYEKCLKLTRQGGTIILDNVLLKGAVYDPDVTDSKTNAMRQLLDKISRDVRVERSIAPVGDGIVIIRKR